MTTLAPFLRRLGIEEAPPPEVQRDDVLQRLDPPGPEPDHRAAALGEMVALLSETLFDIAAPDPATVAEIREIAAEIASPPTEPAPIDAISRLAYCLENLRRSVRGQIPREKRQPGRTDPLTGLPDAGHARDAFDATWNKRHHSYAALFALTRPETVSVRFGPRAAGELLVILSRHVAENLSMPDKLFRWRGASLVALVERTVPEALIAAELSHIAAPRLEHVISMKERQVTVPISMTWNLLPLNAEKTEEELSTRLNHLALNGWRQLR